MMLRGLGEAVHVDRRGSATSVHLACRAVLIYATYMATNLFRTRGLTSLDVQRNDIGEGAGLLDDASRDAPDLIVWK